MDAGADHGRALHDGHLALVRAAKLVPGSCRGVVFVNPVQFGPAAEIWMPTRGSSTTTSALLRRRPGGGEGVEIAFTPARVAMYPVRPGRTTLVPRPARIRARGLGPGPHIRRHADVVCKLLQIVCPPHLNFRSIRTIATGPGSPMVRASTEFSRRCADRRVRGGEDDG